MKPGPDSFKRIESSYHDVVVTGKVGDKLVGGTGFDAVVVGSKQLAIVVSS